MSSNTPIVPIPDDDLSSTDEEQATREVDGEDVLDPDADDELIDSADADRIASGGDAEL